ncbi:MAG: HEAT repeat domain-containing protein [Candidatus Electrothrix sp. AU1_5]|nr:HEAT repeat domain-containing protein [Candidatus Electrothrix gigas]
MKQTGYCFAPKKGDQEALLDQVLHDLAKREQEKQFGVQELLELKELPLLVEPPHLQIVCRELWHHHRDDQLREISHTAYQQAGRTEGILEIYFLRKIHQFSKKEQALASAAFDHLIGQRSTKIAHSLGRLAELSRVAEKDLQPVLDRLQDGAVLRRQKRGEEFWYELYHDIFSESIDKWNREFKTRQRLKRFARGAVAVLIAGGLLFAGNNWRVNHYGLYLASQEGVFDRIEVHQGTLAGWDMFQQRDFRYESPFLRQELEADKRFDRSIVEDRKNTRARLAGRLPILDRLPRYAENGLYSKIYRSEQNKEDKLVETILKTGEKDLIKPLAPQLASVRTAKSVDLLLRIVREQKNENAVTALAQLGEKAHLVTLLEDEGSVKDEDGDEKPVRMSAAESLSRLGHSSASPALIKLLKSTDEDMLTNFMDTLMELGDSSVVPELVKLLKSTNEDMRVNIVYALSELGNNSVVPELVKLLKDANEGVRRNAAFTLSILGDSSVVPELVKLLKDANEDVRMNAARVLGKLGDSSVAPELVKLLKDANEDVRMNAARVLGKLGDSSVAPKYVKFFVDEDARHSAAEALAELGDSSVTPELVNSNSAHKKHLMI